MLYILLLNLIKHELYVTAHFFGTYTFGQIM